MTEQQQLFAEISLRAFARKKSPFDE